MFTAFPVLVDLYRGPLQLEKGEAEEEACGQPRVGLLGVRVVGSLQAGSYGQPHCLRVPPELQLEARRCPSRMNAKAG